MEICRPTLREAVKVLHDAGLIEVRRGAGGGMFVATEVVPPELVARRRDMRIDEVAQVLEARRLIEPRVAQLAAMRAGDEDFDAMERTIEDQRAIVEPGSILQRGREDRFLPLDVHFHLALARATGNDVSSGSCARCSATSRSRATWRCTSRPCRTGRSTSTSARWPPSAPATSTRVDEVMDEHLGQLERTWEQETGTALIRPTPGFLVCRGHEAGRRRSRCAAVALAGCGGTATTTAEEPFRDVTEDVREPAAASAVDERRGGAARSSRSPTCPRTRAASCEEAKRLLDRIARRSREPSVRSGMRTCQTWSSLFTFEAHGA